MSRWKKRVWMSRGFYQERNLRAGGVRMLIRCECVLIRCECVLIRCKCDGEADRAGKLMAHVDGVNA
eukprot:5266724-Pleurochrysis_carterae.AAC.2